VVNSTQIKRAILVLLPALAGFGPILSVVDLAGVNIFAFRLMLMIGYGAIILGVWPHPTLKKSILPFLYFFFLWVLWATAAVFWTYNVNELVSGLLNLIFGILSSIFVMLLVKRSDDIAMIRLGWMVGGVIFCGFGLVELFSDWHFPSSWYDRQPDYAQPFIIMSTFGNPNNFGAFLTLSIALLFGTRKKISIATWALFALFFFLLFLTGSRIGMIGVVIVMFLRFSKSIILMFSLTPLLAVLLLNLTVLARYVDHPELTALISLTENSSDYCSSVNIRLNMVRVAMVGLFDSYMLGVGAGNFSQIVTRFKLDNFTCGITDPHNWFFEIAGEYGLIVFLCYCCSLIAVAVLARRPESLSQKSGVYPTILLVGFIFASAGNSTFSSPPMNWVYYGFFVSLSASSHSRKTH
jgi:hypothetical protein